jgi:protein-S-isoprenylcysteine O-methyltransferase Ste14
MNAFFRWYPAGFAVLCLFTTIYGRAWLVKRRTGIKRAVMLDLGRLDKHTLMMLGYQLVLLAIAAHIALFVMQHGAYAWFGRIVGLEARPVQAAGVLCTVLPWAFMWQAQNHLGESWRMGIDESTPNILKTQGIYRYVRHPIYTAMLLQTFGLFLLMPTWFFLGIVGAAFVGLYGETKLEEAYLLRTHGDQYAAYMATTGRWLPRVVRSASITKSDQPPASPPDSPRQA